MPALIIPAGGAPAIEVHTADLWDACRCGEVHHETVARELVTLDAWFPPLPVSHRRSIIRTLFTH